MQARIASSSLAAGIVPSGSARDRSHRRLPSAASWLVFVALAAGLPSLNAAPWVVVTEIHYHPAEGDALEFVEILNREPPRVRLGGWSLDGEVTFLFPDDTLVLPGERIVVARNPAAFRLRYPGARKVYGPYRGKLDNNGGRLVLRNRTGAKMSEARYRRGGRWPSAPDGFGHTLSLESPYLDPTLAENWQSSSRIGGTPGAPNGFSDESTGELIVRAGDTWRYSHGDVAPRPTWFRSDFDDSRWSEGPSGLGYGDGDDATELPAMRGNYASLFTRHSFEVDSPESFASLILRVDYDDGFVAYLNGKEVARANLGVPGETIDFDRFADSAHEAGSPGEFLIGAATDVLKDGTNVLAVQAHNDDLYSTDLTLIVELESREVESRVRPVLPPRINEVRLPRAGGDPGFVEIYNPSHVPLSLAGYALTDDPFAPAKLPLEIEKRVPPGTWIRVDEIGGLFAPEKDGGEPKNRLSLALTRPADGVVTDVFRFDRPEGERQSAGRFPDGDGSIYTLEKPSPGERNRAEVTDALVINEIMYAPLHGGDEREYIEIYCRGRSALPLAGFRLSGAVKFEFASDVVAKPGEYLLVAKKPEEIARVYGLSRSAVLGPYKGKLGDRREEVRLRDSRGFVIDRVAYADRSPWPRAADGMGSSLELIHPELDNALPAAWAASTEGDKAPWQTFRYAKPHSPVNTGIRSQELQLMLLAEGECFIDGVRFGARGNILSDGDFKRGGDDWQALGTHGRSRPVDAGRKSRDTYFHLIADGRGNPRYNYVTLALDPTLKHGAKYQMAFSARWQSGSPLLLTRIAGQSVAQVHRLKVPERLGTPGKPNSRFSERPMPVVGIPRQFPIVPTTEQEATFDVAISARDRVTSAALHFRPEGEANWNARPLAEVRRGSGIWSGSLPRLPAGKVEFWIGATDSRGAVGTFPASSESERALDGTPHDTALYAVGLIPSSRLPTITLLVSDDEWGALQGRQTLSNRLARASLVFGDLRIYHGVGFRPRGSPFTRRGRNNWRVVMGADSIDGRRTLTLDAQPGGGASNLSERLTFWLIDALDAPNSRMQYVDFRIEGRGEAGTFEDVEKIDRSYLDNWFGPDSDPPSRLAGETGVDRPSPQGSRTTSRRRSFRRRKLGDLDPLGHLHKIDDYWELSLFGGRHYQESFFQYTSSDIEDYRWNFPARANSTDENYAPLVELVQFLDPNHTTDRAFARDLDSMLDVDGWMRVLAVRNLVNDWDTMGGSRGKNSFLFRSTADNRWHLLPWDADLAWGGRDRIDMRKFPAIARLVGTPRNSRLFRGYQEYLGARLLDPQFFADVLDDIEQHARISTGNFADAGRRFRAKASANSFGLRFAVGKARRVKRRDLPDAAEIQGTAPAIVMRFRLDGREGEVELAGESAWQATFDIGPEGGRRKLEALDFGGNVIAAAEISIAARRGAPELQDPVREAPTVTPELRAAIAKVHALEEARRAAEIESPATTIAAKTSSDTDANTESVDSSTQPNSGARRTTIATARGPREGLNHEVDDDGESPATASSRPARDARLESRSPLGDQPRRRGGSELAPAVSRLEPDATPPTDVPSAQKPGPLEPAAPSSGSPTMRIVVFVIAVLIAVQIVIVVRSRRTRSSERAPAQAERARAAPGARAAAGRRAAEGRRAAASPRRPERRPARERPEAPSTEAAAGAPNPIGRAIAQLGCPEFEVARAALRYLEKHLETDIPAVLQSLGDSRTTVIRKVRSSSTGSLSAVAARPGEPGLRVRQLLALLLERSIGRPDAERPTLEDWVKHWRSQG